MGMISAAYRHMVAARMSPEAIEAAIAEMELAASSRTARQERNHRYYEKRKASESVLKKAGSEASESVLIKTPLARVEDISLTIGDSVKKEPSLREGARARKIRTSIAADWSPTEAGQQYALAHGMTAPDVRSELAKFRNHHEAHGKQMASWDAAWRTWCDRFDGYKPQVGPHEKPVNGAMAAIFRSLEKHEREASEFDENEDRSAFSGAVLQLAAAGKRGWG